MPYKIQEVKRGIKTHMIETNKFKTFDNPLDFTNGN